MFSPGQIIKFPTFYFKNGNTPKAKYFIVLANDDDNIIIGSLPTRGNHAPSLITDPHGCIDMPERCFNCYVFEANKVIGINGFSFPLTTHIYGNEVDDYEVVNFELTYPIKGIDYDIVGTLLDEEFRNLKACLLNSRAVKNKIKKFLRR